MSVLDFQNNELFTLTYGALVAQMIKDLENCEEVSETLTAGHRERISLDSFSLKETSR